MARILTGNTTKGRPGGWGRGAKGQFTGRLVNKTKVSGASVRRLFVRDPAKRTALIGTNKDINFINHNINMTSAPSPRVLKADASGATGPGTNRRSTPVGQKHVVSRKINRSIRRTNS